MNMRNMRFCLALALLFPGCLDFESEVRIHEDGSVDRQIVVLGDSAEIVRGDFPLPIDASWRAVTDTAGDGRHRLTAHRSFASVDSMNVALEGEPGRHLRVSAVLETEFDWFYTVYRYRETWHRFHPFTGVALTDYLAESELDLLRRFAFEEDENMGRGDSLALEDINIRFDRWRLQSMFARYWDIVTGAVEARGTSPSTLQRLYDTRDRVYAAVIDKLEQKNLEAVGNILRETVPFLDIETVLGDCREELRAFEAQQDFEDAVMTHDYRMRIVMPGILLSTNAPAIEGSAAVWQDYVKYSYIEDTVLTAESRVLNVWMILILGFVLAALAVLAIVAPLRRRAARQRSGLRA